MLTLFSRPKDGGGVTLSNPTPAPAGVAGRPSPLLAHLAGEFADEIARVWPAPHAPFVLAEAPRRHLVCLALAAAAGAAVRPGPYFVRGALDGSLKRAVADLAPTAPEGLLRALGRLGEAAWPAADYRLLLGRLADPGAGKVLRHADAITAASVRVLSALPPLLVAEGGTLLRLTEDQSRLIATCHDGLLRRDGTEAAQTAARRWAAARTPKALFAQVKEDIGVVSATPFHPGTERLRPLTSRKALSEAARRYRNCLDGCEPEPTSHYYEWVGPPGVIINVVADSLWGWRLEEGRLARNEPVSSDLQTAIAADLRTMGVHLGDSRWNLNWELNRAIREDYRYDSAVEQMACAFGT